MTPTGIIHNESGFVLATVMSVLLLLVFIGIASMTRSTTEQLIAGNEKVRQVNFHETDGGLELGELLVEENLACAGGFTEFPAGSGYAGIPHVASPNDPNVRVDSLDFAWQTTPGSSERAAWDNMDLFFPPSLGVPDNTTGEIEGQTYLRVGGETRNVKGGALQMAAGYVGKGKSTASGGAYKLVTILAKRQGLLGSISEIRSQWRHMVGQGGNCNY